MSALCRGKLWALRVSRTGSQAAADTRRAEPVASFRVQMRHRLSAIFAALALAQLSLGGAVAFCPSHRLSSHDMSAHREHSPARTSCHSANSRANANVPTNHGTPSCDPSAQGACVGMTSCAAVIAFAGPEHLTAGLQADQTRPHVLDLLPGRTLAPEPPPPRI